MKRYLLISCSALALTMASRPAAADPITLAVAAASTASLGSAAATGFTLFGGALTVASGVTAVAANFAIRAALGYALNALASRPQNVSRGYGTNINQLGPALPHQIIYGETRVGGAVVYQTVTAQVTRTNRLHRVIAFAGHEIDSYRSIYINDDEVTLDAAGNVTAPAEYVGKVRIKTYLGTVDQTADPDLMTEVNEWTSAHRLQNIAYVYVRFQDAAAFPNGVPTVSAVIRGKKVEDSRYFVTEGTPTQTYADGDTIQNTDYARDADLFWAVDLTIPETPTGTVFEVGDTNLGVWLGFDGTALVYRAGADDGTPSEAAVLTLDPSRLLSRSITLYGAVDVSENQISLWYRAQGKTGLVLLGTATASGTLGGTGLWANPSTGAVGEVNGTTTGPNTDAFNGTISEARMFSATAAPVTPPAVAWSDNPVMCIRDYLLADYGLAESPASIDEDLFAAAADVCDAQISGEGTYTCNGAFLLDASPEDILRGLLSSLGGVFWNYAGRWAIQAAEYIPPTVELTQDDLRGALSVATRHSRRDNFNSVVGQYKGPATDYQPDNYATVRGGLYVEEDNGISTTAELNLLFTDTEVMAQRIARTFLRRNRKQITVSGAFGLNAMGLRIGNNVMLTIPHMNWSQKVFEVVDWRLGIRDLDIQVNMLLREMDEEVFNGVVVVLQDESGNTLTDESENVLEAIVG